MSKFSKIIVVLCGQAGDSGKGKVAQHYINKSKKSCCIRSVGGPNAGHTIYYKDKKISVHRLPSGAYCPQSISFIGNACYVNPSILLRELCQRQEIMDSPNKIYVSKYAHAILPEYIKEDEAKEKKQGFGSTKQGVSIAAGRKFTYKGVQLQHLCGKSKDLDQCLEYIELVDPFDFFENLNTQKALYKIIEQYRKNNH